MFVDEVKVHARAGRGGKGCVAFHREAFRPKGGPSGGNGGRGGSVILVADHDTNNLIAQYYQPRLFAKNGVHGKGKWMDGAAGKDLRIKVPCGTLVWRVSEPGESSVPSAQYESIDAALVEDENEEGVDEDLIKDIDDSADDLAGEDAEQDTGDGGTEQYVQSSEGAAALEIDLEAEGADEGRQSEVERVLVADLTEHGQEFVICKGGRGGLGNKNFATARRQTPRFAQPGEDGDEGRFVFELRIMADVGLVGYPNAGKSTLLTAISHARPKIAPYPFTTLTPQIGILEYKDFHRLMICDVPGLVEGAHENVGLGHKFLRHIQRCRLVAVVVDMAAEDGRHPCEDYENILNELTLFDPAMASKPCLVAGNKMDEPDAESNLKTFRERFPTVAVIPMSAGFDEGVEDFKWALREQVEIAKASLLS